MKLFIPVRIQIKFLCFLSIFLFSGGLINTAAASSPQANTPPEISADTRCSNCNMKPAMYPKWQTIIVYDNDETATFDGCKCMFKYSLGKRENKRKIKTVWVKDFANGTWINGQKAHYVIGSTTMGPMGKELIPFSTLASAEEFSKKEGGIISDYKHISMETLKPLMNEKMKMKKPMM